MNVMSRRCKRFDAELSFRASALHRNFLEKYAEKHGIGICAAMRDCIDEMMKIEGYIV